MSQWSEDLQKAEQFGEDHSQQADQVVQQGENFAEQETGHRFDQQIGAGAQQLDDRFGGGQQDQGDPSQQQDPQQQDYQQPQQ